MSLKAATQEMQSLTKFGNFYAFCEIWQNVDSCWFTDRPIFKSELDLLIKLNELVI